MPLQKIDYNELLNYIKITKPCFVKNVHEYLKTTCNIKSSQTRTYAINRIIKLGFIERDVNNPRSILKIID